MRIHFVRSGGFTNAVLDVDLDTEAKKIVFGAAGFERSLSPNEIMELQQVFDKSGFFSLAQALENPREPDRFQYAITVHAHGRDHTLQLTESASPPSIQPLLQYLTRLAMGMRAPEQ